MQPSGSITLEDGSTLDMQFDLGVKWLFRSEEHFTLRSGGALSDPLVLCFDEAALNGSFSDFKIQLDHDGDGRKDTFSIAPAGSGFLAYDRNDNGKLDDGSELFRPLTGNGFRELAGLDEDGNGWIDEGIPPWKTSRSGPLTPR